MGQSWKSLAWQARRPAFCLLPAHPASPPAVSMRWQPLPFNGHHWPSHGLCIHLLMPLPVVMRGGLRYPESPSRKLLLPSVAGMCYQRAVSHQRFQTWGVTERHLSGVLSSGSIHPMTNPSTGIKAWPSQCNLGQLQRLHLLQSSLWGGLRLHWGWHYSSMSPSACLPRPSFLPFNLLFHGCPSQMNILHAELSPESALRKTQQATLPAPKCLPPFSFRVYSPSHSSPEVLQRI